MNQAPLYIMSLPGQMTIVLPLLPLIFNSRLTHLFPFSCTFFSTARIAPFASFTIPSHTFLLPSHSIHLPSQQLLTPPVVLCSPHTFSLIFLASKFVVWVSHPLTHMAMLARSILSPYVIYHRCTHTIPGPSRSSPEVQFHPCTITQNKFLNNYYVMLFFKVLQEKRPESHQIRCCI